MRVYELEEGKVYKASKTPLIYRIRKGLFEIYCYSNGRSEWMESGITYNHAITYDFMEITDPSSRVPDESTPIDTKVICWRLNGEKHKRYFAGMKNGKPTAYDFGKTSWNAEGVITWDNMIIAEEEIE